MLFLSKRFRNRCLSSLVFLLSMLAAVVPVAARTGRKLILQSLSNRPDKLSGGDALVHVAVPPGVALKRVRIRLNGQNVRPAFTPDADGHGLTGLIQGMEVGKNELWAKVKGIGAVSLEITNHPITGPVFSGPHETPFFCQTRQFRVYPGGETLGAALDEHCSVATRVDYVYRSTTGNFKLLDLGSPLPNDLVSTTTTAGNTVPYIVRLETGTINRSIYQTAILDDPSQPGPDLQASDPGWNGRLVYIFSGGCRAGWCTQGNTTGGVLNDMMLSQGFATASASLNVFGNNCNDLLAAETMMMVKERFIETYGPPRYTIGWGCSGGSYQLHQIGDNYPGLLDGIVPQCSFPDVGFGTIPTLADARLLENYYLNKASVLWTEEELRAVSGFGVFNSIPNLSTGAARIDPVPGRLDFLSAEFKLIVPHDVRYNPVSNPNGARPTVYDHTINAYGIDRMTGFARRPLDNVGIQYGLGALNTGEISKEQFLDLNEKIGGLDIDANFIPERMVANRKAMKAAYKTGRLLHGSGLATIPILDYDRIYADLAPGGDIHMKFQHFSTRERLIEANGHADNQVMWSGGAGADARRTAIEQAALAAIDKWVANIKNDPTADPLAQKVVRNKPVALVDGCWTKEVPPVFIAEPQFFGGVDLSDTFVCNDLYPAFPFPRMVAGGPLANNIIKCQLKPVDFSDYEVIFTPAEQMRLLRIFPDGVCDWTRPGVEQQGLVGTWLTFTGFGKYKRDVPAAPTMD